MGLSDYRDFAGDILVEGNSLLTMEPKLVLMDEPDSGIDVDALEKIFEASQFVKQRGTTVLVITHSPTVLEKLKLRSL